jgi:hypothetical protein
MLAEGSGDAGHVVIRRPIYEPCGPIFWDDFQSVAALKLTLGREERPLIWTFCPEAVGLLPASYDVLWSFILLTHSHVGYRLTVLLFL